MANFSNFASRFIHNPFYRKNMFKVRYPVIALFGVGCFLLVILINLRILDGDGKGWRHIINSDGRGYYAYLPSLIIDGDPTFKKGVERESRFLGALKTKLTNMLSPIMRQVQCPSFD